jgi:hypothetical protein
MPRDEAAYQGWLKQHTDWHVKLAEAIDEAVVDDAEDEIIVMPREDVRVIRRAMRHWMKKHALPSHQPRRIIHALTHALGECACEEMA